MVDILSSNPSNLLALRILLSVCKQSSNKKMFDLTNDQDLFKALNTNLIKNSRTLRLLSLNILRRFKSLNFLATEEELYSDQYSPSKPCDLFELMYTFEKTEIGFETEKSKLVQLEKIEVMCRYEVLPGEYHHALYNFLIGCLWIKFTPLFPVVHSCVSELINRSSS